MPDPPILLVGASTRAAAWSALRAGLSPAAVDRFGDLDLHAIAPAELAGDWNADACLLAAADRLPPAPWLYTGPIENRPALVESLSRHRPLLGNPPDVLRAVRDPSLVAEALRSADLPHPEIRLSASRLPTDGSWLIKPRSSAGGFGIAPWTGRKRTDPGPSYFQEFIPGPSHSALFLAVGPSARLLGCTLQLLGGGGSRFAYRGSIGPIRRPLAVTEALERAGSALASRFGLRGLFGIDYIEQDGLPFPVEVNPRYTASVEILELATGASLLSAHRLAFDPQAIGASPHKPARALVVGKRVLFARHSFRVPEDPPWPSSPLNPWELPAIADLPVPGTTFAPGEPVLTVFASGDNPSACRRELDAAAGRWTRLLGTWSL